MSAPELLTAHLGLMANYNQWMNRKVYDTAARLSPEQLAENRGAFFGSVLGTLNHIMVGDTVWLQRFAAALPDHAELDPVRRLARPSALNAILFDDLDALRRQRELLDDAIIAFSASLSEAELASTLHYHSMLGSPASRQLFGVLMHFFNHGTHHRGQVTTLLTQFGLDVGPTDLVILVPQH